MVVRGIGFVFVLCRPVNLLKQCRVLSRALSMSPASGNRDLKNSKFRDFNEQFLEESKRKYEDTFGNIENFEMTFQRIKDDPEDVKEYQRERKAQGKTIAEYIKEIKFHLDNFDYKSALKVLEVDMVNDKKPAHIFVYKVLISYNAKIGNLEEAYRLFINFKKRQGRVTGAMYTSMFNACANCKSSFLALEKADAVRECMRNNESHVINISNYNAMMKAYGRHGDLATCMKIMDEVLFKRDKVHSMTYSFLLQACITDKNAGLRHALIVWRKMIQSRVKPSVFSFNLLLRCVRECSLGDAFLISNLMEEIQKESGKFFKRKVEIKTVNNKKIRTVLKIPASGMELTPVESQFQRETVKGNIMELNCVESAESVQPSSENFKLLKNHFSKNEGNYLSNHGSHLKAEGDDISLKSEENLQSILREKEHCKSNFEVSIPPDEAEVPNLLALQPSIGSAIKFVAMTKPHYRFMLVGGMKGFLKTMAEFGVNPDIKTFTLMLDVIPSSLEAEQELLSLMKMYKIPLDVGFFNVLIRRRFLRAEDFLVKDCLQQMHALNLRPDLVTFGVLALGCRTYESGMELLWNVRNCGYRVNSEILGTLLNKAKFARDMNYVSAIIKEAKECDVQLSQRFLGQLASLIRREQHLRKKEGEGRLIKSEESTMAADIVSTQ